MSRQGFSLIAWSLVGVFIHTYSIFHISIFLEYSISNDPQLRQF